MSDFARKLEEARARLPLRQLMQQHGRGPRHEAGWKSFDCPFCEHQKCAGLFTTNGVELFKCHYNPCPTGNTALDEIGFLGQVLGLNRKDAWITYLKEAGVWQERDRHAPSVMPGKAPRRRPLPSTEVQEPPAPVEPPDERFEDLPPAPSEPHTSAAATEPTADSPGPHEREPGMEPEDAVGAGGVPGRTLGGGVNASTTDELLPRPPHAEASSLPDIGASVEQPLSPTVAGLESRAPDAPPFPAAAGAGQEEAGDGNTPAAPPAPVTAEPTDGSPSPGKGGEPPAAKGKSEPEDKGPLGALRWFFARLTLSAEDARSLWVKRGLTPATCELLGFRSNGRENRAILEGMRGIFPDPALLESGLWLPGVKLSDPIRPNPQFYGFGIVGKKNGEFEWGWSRPVLIPYWDEEHQLIHLRPHKGMSKDKAARFYVARVQASASNGIFREAAVASVPGITMAKPMFGEICEWLENAAAHYAVITEGEFKAAALWQALNCVPGLTVLPRGTALREVVIAFDNEEKGDPALPGYKEEKWKRYDAEIWARHLARSLSKEGFDGRVGHLPDRWRDGKGKADWDGVLAGMAGRLSKNAAWQDQPEAVWQAIAAECREEFLKVLKAGIRVEEAWQAGLFMGEEERIIRSGLERISYVAKLPVGGDHEVTVARRLMRLAGKLKQDDERLAAKARGFLVTLAKAYQDLKGGYYTFRPLREDAADRWLGYLQHARSNEDVEVSRACEVALQGIPQRCSDFHLRAHYVLNRLNGTRERVVSLHNIHGANSPLVSLPSAPFAQPSKFREWLLNNISGATWRAGERELNDLQADVAREVAFKDVAEVAVRGYHEESKCWFFEDVCYAPDGQEVFAGRDGVIWVKGTAGLTQGYRLSETDHEGQGFHQKLPRMRPSVAYSEEQTRALFVEVCQRMLETIGDYGGWLALGAILIYGAGPELYDLHTAFPGLWLHGEPGQGKSSVARWLLRLWGFSKETGLPLPDSTKVGVSIILQQYGNLPVWLEEYQPDCPKWMLDKIKAAYNRESGAKKTFDEGDRKIRAGAMITGVATCHQDAQVSSRYCHVLVSETRRKANHYEWFEENSPLFYVLGRHILRHRAEYARLALEGMRSWMENKELGSAVSPRARLVHAAAYGGIYGLVGLLRSHGPADLRAYRDYLIAHTRESSTEVREQVNVNQFWADLLAALKSDAFGVTPSERRRVFKVVENKRAESPVSEWQRGVGAESSEKEWKSYLLYFVPDPVIDMLRRYKRLQGRDLPLDKADLRSQMRTRPYWVMPKDDTHRERFGDSRSKQSCWCIDLDRHDLGYRGVSDEEFERSLHRDGNPEADFLPRSSGEWEDPRRGDLFALVDSLKGRNEGDEQKELGQ